MRIHNDEGSVFNLDVRSIAHQDRVGERCWDGKKIARVLQKLISPRFMRISRLHTTSSAFSSSILCSESGRESEQKAISFEISVGLGKKFDSVVCTVFSPNAGCTGVATVTAVMGEALDDH